MPYTISVELSYAPNLPTYQEYLLNDVTTNSTDP